MSVNFTKTYAGALLLIAALPPRTFAVEPADVQAVVKVEMEKRRIPGCAVAVLRDNQVAVMDAQGLANVELQVSARPSHVFEIGSLTKPFTATLVQLAAADGKLTLDDKLSLHLPDAPAAWKDVTLRQLLSHTSGIPNYTSALDTTRKLRRDYTPQEIVGLVSDKPMDFAPGSRWAYSNTGYFLLGLVLEKVSGKPYCELLAERVTAPLGLGSTRCNDRSAIVPSRVSGYTQAASGLANAEGLSTTHPFSAGVLLSSLEDMTRWDAAYWSGKVLQPAALEQAWTQVKLADGSVTRYGLGWSVDSMEGHSVVGHDGGISGFNASQLHFPDDKLSVIVLVNTDAVSASAVARAVAALWIPELKISDTPIADSDPALTARLRALLGSVAQGTATADQFTPEAAQALFPTVMERATAYLASLGPLKEFFLVERKVIPELSTLKYRATYEKLPLSVEFNVKSDGKIAGLRLVPL